MTADGKRDPRKTLLAVASGGGHWDELMVLGTAFQDFATTYVTTNADVVGGITGDIRVVADCNRRQPLRSLQCAVDLFGIVRRLRPDVVVTTGAAPGAIALLLGWAFGARTIWIDSLASASKLSMSGKFTRHFAHLHLTQWHHLADGTRTRFMGSVL